MDIVAQHVFSFLQGSFETWWASSPDGDKYGRVLVEITVRKSHSLHIKCKRGRREGVSSLILHLASPGSASLNLFWHQNQAGKRGRNQGDGLQEVGTGPFSSLIHAYDAKMGTHPHFCPARMGTKTCKMAWVGPKAFEPRSSHLEAVELSLS